MKTNSIFGPLLLLLLICSISVVAQETSSEVLTLDQATALAISHNRIVQNSKLAVDKVNDQLAATRTLRYPTFNLYALGSQQLASLDFTFERGVFGTYQGLGPIPATETVISTPKQPTAIIIGSVTQPLSQQYRIRLNLDQIELSKQVANEELRQQQQATVNDVKQLYYGILQSQSAIKSNQQSVELYRELDRVTTDLVAQQAALKSQNLDVKAKLAKEEYDGLNLRNQLASQKEQLNNLLGRDIRTNFEVAPLPELTIFEMDLVSAQNRALDQRPEIKEAQLKVKQAELDRRIKKAEYLPDVSLGLNYVSPRNFNDFVPRNYASAGVIFSWDVFDWGKKSRELDGKRKSAEQAQNGLVETQNRILIDVNTRFRKVQQTRELLRVVQLAQDAAKEKLRVAQNKYQVQAALLSDVLQMQTGVVETDHQYQQALLAFWAARAELEKALGDDK
ncbi:MAG TPA: TolC family protein [Pyrinomonadaceae bacterium]